MNIYEIACALLAKLTAGTPGQALLLERFLQELPEYERGQITKVITRFSPDTDLRALCDPEIDTPLDLLTADVILQTEWPEPVWAAPGLLPVGLTILAGAPKVGKSWLALQVAQAVASGGRLFGEKVPQGPILYLALEDPPRRLQDRMRKQGWPLGLEADFLPLGDFEVQVGDLRAGGADRLARGIQQRGYRMVTIDTLSRSVFGKQNEAEEMTAWLTPIQEMAHDCGCAIVLIDHHRKAGGTDPDAIRDILGSTAKGAMADTALGLYRERGKTGARLVITGREVEERTLHLRMDWLTGAWQLEEARVRVTQQQEEILEVLEEIGPARVTKVAEAVGREKGTLYKQLASLEKKGRVYQKGVKWGLVKK